MTHDSYTSVPKLIIPSNSIRLLNVVGQGIIVFPNSITFACNYKLGFFDQLCEYTQYVGVKSM